VLTIRQYEGKSYRMFTEWLVEAHYLRMFLQISRIPHFTTLQKFSDRIRVRCCGNLDVTETWTYWTIQRPDGTPYGEGKGVIMTKDGGEVATATGHGEGRMTDPEKMKYLGAVGKFEK